MDFLREMGSGQRGASQAGMEPQQSQQYIHGGDYGAQGRVWPAGCRGFLCWVVTTFGKHSDDVDAEVAQRSKIGVKKALCSDGR